VGWLYFAISTTKGKLIDVLGCEIAPLIVPLNSK
jgi:hypothetical protein